MLMIKEIRQGVLMIVPALFLAYFAAAVAQNHKESSLSLQLDFDQDGLSNKEEELYGTDPDNPDTDGDGFSDGVEVANGYDPLIHKDRGDRLMGLDTTQPVTSDNVNFSRHLTSELRTRVAGIAFDVATGKEVTLDDVNKEMQSFVDRAVSEDEVPTVDVNTLRIKRQEYADLSADERKRRVSQDVQDYAAAIGYIFALARQSAGFTSPADVLTADGADVVVNEALLQAEMLADDYTADTPFTQMLNASEKVVREMQELEIPEVVVPLHIEGLQIALMTNDLAKDAREIDLAADPAAAAVVYSRAAALTALGASFSEKVNEFARKYLSEDATTDSRGSEEEDES